MKKVSILLAIIISCILLSSCTKQTNQNPEKRTVYAMDTVITLTAYGKNAASVLENSEIEINRLDALLSKGNEQGEIYALNQSGSGTVSSETAEIIKNAIEISEQTNGAFDITIAPVMDMWGFFGHEYRIPSETELTEALAKVGYNNILINQNNITLSNNAALDLGGIAKGYASDKLTEIFKSNNIQSGLISFGSAIQTIGTKPDGSKWKIGIADPQNKDSYIATVTLSDKCIVTSGSYEQVFEDNGEKYHHIIDPSTGYPANNGLASVSIISDSAEKSDALSTALFVMGFDKAVEYWQEYGGFDMVLITDNNEIYYTEGINVDIVSSYDKEAILIKKNQ